MHVHPRLVIFDRVDIFLWGNSTYNETIKNFHVIVPHILTSTNQNYFEILAGKYNTVSRQYTYMFIQQLVAYSPTGASYTSKTISNTMMLELSGKAGSYPASMIGDIAPVSGFYALSGSSAIIISSTWSLYNNLTHLAANLQNNNSATTCRSQFIWDQTI
jgi:hypothetical protein